VLNEQTTISELVAKDLLKFIDINTKYSPWSSMAFQLEVTCGASVLVTIAAERERYAQVVDRIVGQIWDSAADITEMPVGVPISVFPRNLVMQTALKQYMLYHLKTFDKVATRHYVRSIKPILLNELRHLIRGLEKVGRAWEYRYIGNVLRNLPTWGHFRAHLQDEYVAALDFFLENINLVNSRTKFTKKWKAKL
ncbi:hypothetical protein NQ317_015553, partial [Molorchus minor]